MYKYNDAELSRDDHLGLQINYDYSPKSITPIST